MAVKNVSGLNHWAFFPKQSDLINKEIMRTKHINYHDYEYVG